MVLTRLFKPASVRRFLKQNEGIAAVEFGLILPFLMILFLGAIEISRAVIMARRFNLVTSMASDLIAREQQMKTADMQGVQDAVTTVWAPYDLGDLKLEVLSVRSARQTAVQMAPGTTYVDWGYSMLNAPVKAECSPYPLPNNMLSMGSSTIVVNASYTFKTLFGATVPGMQPQMVWTASSSHSPRNLCVDYKQTNCISACE